jgi:hypothetical protein
MVRDQEVGGFNPLAPTKSLKDSQAVRQKREQPRSQDQ